MGLRVGRAHCRNVDVLPLLNLLLLWPEGVGRKLGLAACRGAEPEVGVAIEEGAVGAKILEHLHGRAVLDVFRWADISMLITMNKLFAVELVAHVGLLLLGRCGGAVAVRLRRGRLADAGSLRAAIPPELLEPSLPPLRS